MSYNKIYGYYIIKGLYDKLRACLFMAPAKLLLHFKQNSPFIMNNINLMKTVQTPKNNSWQKPDDFAPNVFAFKFLIIVILE